MRDVTHKKKTLRAATARGSLTVGPAGLEALRARQVPKGDPFVIAETAAHAGVNKTPELIPHCHPIRLENMEVEFELEGDTVTVTVTAEASEKTGMEMEAITAVTVAVLNLYDLMKPIEEELQIGPVDLVSKSGGYSDFREESLRGENRTAAVLVTSDPIYEGTEGEAAGTILRDRLEEEGLEVLHYGILPAEEETIRERLLAFCGEGIDFVATAGGVGPDPRDVTPGVVGEVLDRDLPGVAETIRGYTQDRLPGSMVSRAVAGHRGGTLLVTFPADVEELRMALDAVFPGVSRFYAGRGENENSRPE